MAPKKLKGLGMGLEALLGPSRADEPAASGSPTLLPLAQLQPGRYQPRTRMDEGALYELAESIRTQGVMQPLLVRPLSGAGAAPRYEIIAGERRSRAAQLAGLAEVPVLVREVPDEQAAVMALVENMQREDLNPLEEAQGLRRLVQEFGLTHDQAAQAVGRSRSAASNLLRLLNLAAPVQQMLMAGDLDMGHARALLPLDGAQQVMVAHQVVARKLSVRETETLAARSQASAPAGKGKGKAQGSSAKAQGKSRDITRVEEALADHLAAPVEIRLQGQARGAQAGEVAIRFGSMDELNSLLQRLGLSDA